MLNTLFKYTKRNHNSILNKKIDFFKEAVKNIKTSGTVVPSSRFLANNILKSIDFENAKVIVELGPGNGAITKHLLKRIKSDTKLICFEINDVFYKDLKKIKNPQLFVVNESAELIKSVVYKQGFDEVDYIVSSLPLAILPSELTHTILDNSYAILKAKGQFLQFQYSLSYYSKLKEFFGGNITLGFEPINFPPAFIYKCAKK